MIRKSCSINEGWWFVPGFDDAMLMGDLQSHWQEVRIPHSVVETPYNYFSEHRYQGVWGYGRQIEINPSSFCESQVLSVEWTAEQIEKADIDWDWFVRFEGAAHAVTVYVDGEEIGRHMGGYTSFEMQLPERVIDGRRHWLSVALDSSEQLNCPPFGHVVDYLTYGGIYREVTLERRPKRRIDNYYAYGTDLLTDKPQLICELSMDALCESTFHFELSELPLAKSLEEWQKLSLRNHLLTNNPFRKIVLTQSLSCNSISEDKRYRFALDLPNKEVDNWQLWHVDAPYRYQLKVTCEQNQKIVDEIVVNIGLREAEFKADGFYLNGKRLQLTGINRHQSFAYVGYAMPRGPQWHDAHILKKELGMNAVRTAHYPQSHHFIEACDVLGLLVFTEIPGWQHIGDQEWQGHLINMVEEMVVDYRHHPSIVLWGVRINESLDLESLYRSTNDLARKLDPQRQTGGVRYLRNSQLLEDVYTFNDFSYNAVAKGQRGILSRAKVTSEHKAAYIVSEYNGHMFPTKSFDTIKHRAEHARRHARVLSAINTEPGVAGGFAWCMFDYNTHKDFGSGDGICHHGILDLFRNEKLAAAVYSSQMSSDQRFVLAVDSELHIGDYPAGAMGAITVYTNAEYLNLYKNDQYIGQYARSKESESMYPGLKNPPIVLQDLVGEALAQGEGFSKAKADRIKKLLIAGAQYGTEHLPLWAWLLVARLVILEGFKPSEGVKLYSKYIGNWGDAMTQYTFEGLSGETALGRIHMGTGGEARLQVSVDRLNLVEGKTYDVACVRFVSVDKSGMRLPYDNGVVTLTCEGGIELIGPSVIALQGGMGGTYVKTKRLEDGEVAFGELTLERQGSNIEKIAFIVHSESEGDL